MRRSIIATGEIYHIFNRSVGNEILNNSRNDLNRIIELVDFYRFPQDIRYSYFNNLNVTQKKKYKKSFLKKKPLVEIYCYSFMPSHYHFELKQIQDNGIKIFISNFQNGFAKYYNKKNHRNGSLFIHPFKARWIETDEEFIHLSRYIHLNPVSSYIINFNQLCSDNSTSFPYYVSEKQGDLLNKKPILNFFSSVGNYIKFVADRITYQQELNKIKHLLFE